MTEAKRIFVVAAADALVEGAHCSRTCPHLFCPPDGTRRAFCVAYGVELTLRIVARVESYQRHQLCRSMERLCGHHELGAEHG